MGIFDAFILGVLQGLTEFIPVSSSGHLVLGESLLGLRVTVLKSFDVAVHIGTLCAILVYFWRDWLEILKSIPGLKNLQVKKFLSRDDPGIGLLFFIAIGTVPAVLAALFFENQIDAFFRNTAMVALCMIIVGLVFFAAEFVNKRVKKSGLNWWRALIIGCAQAVALIPGVSRSGSTIAAGLFQGITREKAARFSFLLGAPAMAGAGIWTGLNGNGVGSVEVWPVIAGFLASAVTGFLAISFLMRFLRKHTLNIFAVYLVVVGVILLV